MVWQRGSCAEYDAWGTAFGNGPHWTFDGLTPYFERVEQWTAPADGSSALLTETSVGIDSLAASHGHLGPLAISYNNYLTDLDRPLVEAAAQLGLTSNPNPDAGNSTGFPTSGVARSVDPVTGKRTYAASAYYAAKERRRANLVVLTGAVVTKILWEEAKFGREPRAKAVTYVVGNKTYEARIKKEVILSAGKCSLLE